MGWHTANFLKQPLLLLVPLVYFIVAVGIGIAQRWFVSSTLIHGHRWIDWSGFKEFLGRQALISAAILAVILILESLLYTATAFIWVTRKIGLRSAQFAVAIGIAVLGTTAHYFKLWRKKWYGFVEMNFGFWSAVFVAGTLTPGSVDLAKWSPLQVRPT